MVLAPINVWNYHTKFRHNVGMNKCVKEHQKPDIAVENRGKMGCQSSLSF